MLIIDFHIGAHRPRIKLHCTITLSIYRQYAEASQGFSADFTNLNLCTVIVDNYLVNFGAVFVGSAVGGVFRHFISSAIQHYMGGRFPWGTLAVNATGALLVGILAALASGSGYLAGWTEAQLLLIIGVCGSYTTVSSFALQTMVLSQDRQWALAGLNLLGSLLLCLIGVWVGLQLGAVMA